MMLTARFSSHVVRWALSIACLGWLAPGTPAVHAQDAGVCAAPVSAAQDRLDQLGVAAAARGGLDLDITRQCAGFSIVVQRGVERAVAEDYARHAERVVAQLSAESQVSLAPRAVLFVFVDQAGMALAERVVGGMSTETREPRAGDAWLNTIWLDDSQYADSPERLHALAHEFTHLFAAFATRGREVPIWFEEGFAVDSEVALSRATHPLAAEVLAGEERSAVLSALDSPRRPLFELAELTSNVEWQARYSSFAAMNLQYAQAYATLRVALGEVERAAAWSVLRAVGSGADFEHAFAAELGESAEVDARARADWRSEVTREPERLELDVRVAAPSDGAPVRLTITSYAGTQVSESKALLSPDVVYSFGSARRSAGRVDRGAVGYDPHGSGQ